MGGNQGEIFRLSFVNIHYNTKTNTIHLWEKIKGELFYDEIEWVPYVFEKHPNGTIQTIDGKLVKRKDFRSYREYYNYCDEHADIFENKVKPEIQFLAERYYKIPDDKLEVPKLRIYTIDIEVVNRAGFPSPLQANDPVVLISIRDSLNKKVITFGINKYTGKSDVYYRKCSNEKELLLRFFDFMHKRPGDIITGWNVYGFDLLYLINRSKMLFGDETDLYKKLSPINEVRTWKAKESNYENIDIAGVNILDYMDVYKWYAPVKLERYKLDYVANYELEKGKLDYSEYNDLNELFNQNYNKYVDYNIIDVKRVDQLEDKLRYIKLIQALSLLTKCPMKYYQAMTQLIEGALITYFRRNDMCAPYFAGGHQETFPAAYVKEPQKGMHEWVIDIDIASSYPSHIITLNMSNETYFGRVMDLTEKDIISSMRKKQFPEFQLMKEPKEKTFKDKTLQKFNAGLKRGLFAVAPCGSIFTTLKPGVIAAVEKAVFFKRKEVKGRMKNVKKKAVDVQGVEKQQLEDRGNELFSLQWAIKILLNAMFGITAVPYSRYFNPNIAEAITSCGRHTIKQSEDFINEYFYNHGMKEDSVAYIDTDSLFIRLGRYFDLTDNNWKNKNDDVKIKQILQFSKELENYVNNRIFNETQLIDYNSQVYDYKIMFKQEIIAKTALFVKKKKYSYWVVNEEGVPCDKLATKGLEIIRSDSAEAVRVKLKHIYEMIMKNEEPKKLSNTITKYRKELFSVPPEAIANNMSVNHINKYLGTGKIKKHTPYHVKGVFNYNLVLKELQLEHKYDKIHEGNKAKVAYVKDNPFNIDVITFTTWPKEFDQYLVVDYDAMIEKFFLKKIGFLLEAMGREDLLMDNSNEDLLNSFFS